MNYFGTILSALILVWIGISPIQQVQRSAPTVRDVFAAANISDLRQYPDDFLNTPVTPSPGKKYFQASYHINPSAEAFYVISRDLKIVGELNGWELLTLPDESIVYHRNQVHFAPTHALEIAVFDPESRQDRVIYPPTPTEPVRQAFIDRVAAVYRERGEAWFREHNHHMDPQMFDSRLIGDPALDLRNQTITFTVQYGDPDNASDPLPFMERVRVTCSPISPPVRLRCHESRS